MQRATNANRYGAPTLWVDIDDLHIPCAVPTVDMTERFLEKAKRVVELTGGVLTEEGYDSVFELFAEILSCNHNFMTFTPEDLKKKRVTVTQVMGVITDWVIFIGELPNLKN